MRPFFWGGRGGGRLKTSWAQILEDLREQDQTRLLLIEEDTLRIQHFSPIDSLQFKLLQGQNTVHQITNNSQIYNNDTHVHIQYQHLPPVVKND